MATKYSPAFKSSIIAKMLPPNNVSVPDLAGETQIPMDTLYCWRSKAVKDADGAVLAATAKGVLSSQEKFAVVLETASLHETELSAYCRRKGLYPQAIEAWRANCMAANATVSGKAERAEVRAQKLEIRGHPCPHPRQEGRVRRFVLDALPRGEGANPQHLDHRAAHPQLQVDHLAGAKIDQATGDRPIQIEDRGLARRIRQPCPCPCPCPCPDHAVQGRQAQGVRHQAQLALVEPGAVQLALQPLPHQSDRVGPTPVVSSDHTLGPGPVGPAGAPPPVARWPII